MSGEAKEVAGVAADPSAPQTTSMFVLPMFRVAKIGGFDQNKDGLVQALMNRREFDKGVPASTAVSGAWQSKPDLHKWENLHINWLVSAIERNAREILAPQGIKKVETVEMWANINLRGGWNLAHDHGAHPLTGILHVQADEKSDSLLEIFNPLPVPHLYGLPSAVRLKASPGQFALWPGPLKHTVWPNLSDVPRISVGFNFVFGF